ncbi:SatD family protein [Xylanimonas ulmi]|uniref:SatD family protein n=1 Tax=Xylanimonas ulmi TaxID=228973 RepID=A0A4Q7LZQ7_9MICO|nr:SatD family protein [Xylanibacterium ulmi]RZS60926.1 SatD family protein [Xylanibacterium ulmi]
MIVLTADQRGSTNDVDRVPRALEVLTGLCEGRHGLALAFDRTVGDEVQGLLTAAPDGAALAVDLVLALDRERGWSVGLGVGDVARPLPASSREAAGPAYAHARRAVERAKRQPGAGGIAVEADDAARAAEVQALLRLVAAVAARRTDAGWEAVDALNRTGSQRRAATTLGVTAQAVSQRLLAASWAEEAATRPVVARLLAALAER